MPIRANKQVVLTGAVASVAALLIFSFAAGVSLTPVSSELQQIRIVERGSSLGGPDSFIRDGGKSAILVKTNPETIKLTRGESTTVMLNISHVGGTEALNEVNLTPTVFQGAVLLPSAVDKTTVEERAELLSQGKPIPGSIELSSLVNFSEARIKVLAGETKTMQMTISLPKDLPDEIIGKSIHFSPSLEIEEMKNAAPENANDAVVFSDMVTVVVVA